MHSFEESGLDTEAAAPPTLDGYDVFECIGVGGLGAVYRARQRSTGVDVAVKVVRSEADDEDGWRRTERELRALAGLRGHAHVVGVLEVIPAGDFRALVVEYAPGGSINDRVENSGPFDVAEIVFVGRQVAHALDSAHERGIVHRDIKPHNLLIDSFGQIKVCDFGIASLLREEEFKDRTTRLTARYASPEDVEDEPDMLGPPSDVYSLGATLLLLRRGAAPTTLERVTGWTPPVRPDDEIGGQLDELISECLRLDPLDRPTARSVYDRLRELETELSHPFTGFGLDDEATDSDDQYVPIAPARSLDDTVPRPTADDTLPRPIADGANSQRPLPIDVLDTTTDRVMRAEFQAAIETLPPPPVDAKRSDATFDDPPDSDDLWASSTAAVPRPTSDPPVPWGRLAVAGVSVAALVVVGFMVFGRTRGADDTAISTTQVTVLSPTVAPAAPAEVASVELVDRPAGLDDIAEMEWPTAERGACFVQLDDLDDPAAVPCTEPHDLQSLGHQSVEADLGASPGDAAIGAAAGRVCSDLATGIASFEGSDELSIEATVPSAAAWAAGDQTVQCWLRVVDRRLVGDALT